MGRTPSTDELVPELTFDEIDRAFDNNEFCFYLQPKCNAATGAIVGAEALVRWNHPKYGVVSPGRFVPMLEQAGQISRLDVFVWRSVVRMLARWEREGRNLVPISVNVSMVDIDQMDVADTLTGLLNERCRRSAAPSGNHRKRRGQEPVQSGKHHPQAACGQHRGADG